MKQPIFNKYQTPTIEERIKLLKESIKKLRKLKGYENIVKKHREQLKELKNVI